MLCEEGLHRLNGLRLVFAFCLYGNCLATLDAETHHAHHTADIGGLSVLLDLNFARKLLCFLRQNTCRAGMDSDFVLNGVNKRLHNL